MSIAAENILEKSLDNNQEEIDPLQKATGVYVTIHGHFYQPPRENPYLETIERQPSAYPYHDWNERIYHECYRPNAFARILNDQGEVVNIVNNFEYLSFNIGPTLMSWLEKYDVEVYQRILEGDRKSCERFHGHGNAIAQVYNHIIMPLANERDKYTQIRWGKEDFRSRFGRDPEGMWLAETAVDYATLKALIDEGIRFTILAPSQAERCRVMSSEDDPNPQWHEVGGGQIDPTRPYRCFINEKDYIDIFFYDGPISRDMGFNDVLSNSHHFTGRLGQAVRGDRRPAQLINVATDGETFGHHKGGTEKCLAYAFTYEFPQQEWTVTNFAHYLSIDPPTWEVVLKPVTAWSCSHGVNRWQDDCGCGGDGLWHQKWRRPLRNALNWLRDEIVQIYEDVAPKYFHTHWQARDEYIKVIRDRSSDNVKAFLNSFQCRSLSPSEQIDALRLLEMQRYSLLIYTSCAWFFEEISRPEGVQILRYAGRVIELAGDIAGVQLEPAFLKQIALAPSNIDSFGNGAEIYQQLVKSAQVGFEQVVAHYAISSLFDTYSLQERIYCYEISQVNYQKQMMGALSLAMGQVRLTSEVTWESVNLAFSVLHLGGWDFHCCIQPFSGRTAYNQIKDELFNILNTASAAQTILAMNNLFGKSTFNLQHLFVEERHRIVELVSNATKTRLDQVYAQIYRDNYSILLAFQREGLPVPQELQVAAEVTLSNRILKTICSLEQLAYEPEQIKNYLTELRASATEADRMSCQLKIDRGKEILEQIIQRSLWQILEDNDPNNLLDDIHAIEMMIDIGRQLNLNLCLDRAQELYCYSLHDRIVPNCFESDSPETLCPWDVIQMRPLLKLGKTLAVDVHKWLERLSLVF
jgi:alpha-amylase/alpha-mannosidase (GH57 family)